MLENEGQTSGSVIFLNTIMTAKPKQLSSAFRYTAHRL